MTLITCTECNASISDQATSCPQCGRPREQTGEHAVAQAGGQVAAPLRSIARKVASISLVVILLGVSCVIAGLFLTQKTSAEVYLAGDDVFVLPVVNTASFVRVSVGFDVRSSGSHASLFLVERQEDVDELKRRAAAGETDLDGINLLRWRGSWRDDPSFIDSWPVPLWSGVGLYPEWIDIEQRLDEFFVVIVNRERGGWKVREDDPMNEPLRGKLTVRWRPRTPD